MRKPIVAGNWKMNTTPAEASALAKGVAAAVQNMDKVEVVICPPFTSLAAAAEALGQGANVGLGAQNMHEKASGAYTGEVSASMLLGLGCAYVILGHSERRTYFGETDAIVNAKTKAALAAGLTPIVCVGETLEERQSGKTTDVVGTQVRGSLAGLGSDELKKLVVAYEPVWAIGTGLTASPEQAQEVHAFIRKTLAALSDAATAETVRIQYGGSMKPDNAVELMAQPDIDGGLIGGAALKADSFAGIVKAAQG